MPGSSDADPSTTRAGAGTRSWLGLLVLALPTMLLSLDLSVLYLALPHLSADLGASSTQQLWITDIYVFMTAGLLITMGSVGDRIGRRRLLLLGAPIFGAASLLAAFAPTPELLIAARAVLGAAGAMLLPSTLSLLRTMFTTSRQLASAVAIWTTAYMAGVVLGPVVGGLMLQRFWWGSVFLLALPVMALLLVAGPVLLPEHRPDGRARIDLTSVALSFVTILPTIHGLKSFATDGVTTSAVVAVGVGLVAGTVFVVRQRQLSEPLLDLGLLRIRTVAATLVIALLVAATQNGNTLLIAMYLQQVEGLAAVRAGLWLAVPSLALIATINLTPRLAARIRPAVVLAGGSLIAVVGAATLTQVNPAHGFATLLAGAVLLYAGIGPAGALINHLILGSTPSEKAGSAASMASTSGELGIAVGIAVFGSLSTFVYRRDLTLSDAVPAQAATAGQESLVDATEAATQLPHHAADQLLVAAQAAFTSSLQTVAATTAVVLLGVGVLATTWLRHVPRIGRSS